MSTVSARKAIPLVCEDLVLTLGLTHQIHDFSGTHRVAVCSNTSLGIKKDCGRRKVNVEKLAKV
jgi:hypothetical protein